MEQKITRIGTRGSALALAQTELVISAIREKCPGADIERVIISTKGDRETDKPVSSFGDKGVFITEIEEALSNGSIDMAVHSAKDLPGELKEGLCIPCVLPREDARDVLVTRAGTLLEDLRDRDSVTIGTGSKRRQMQFARLCNNAAFKEIRGNVDTRINKLLRGEYDGIILAAAGLKRLGLDSVKDLSYKYFDKDEIMPAGGQGIIAVEARREDAEGDTFTGRILRDINDGDTFLNFQIERKIIEASGAGCNNSIGVISYFYYKYNEEFLCVNLLKEFSGQEGTEHGFRETGRREDASHLTYRAIRYLKEGY
ncbi:MAG: hydroxymethylbilane synthase [Lachnospiraceae bacterium]|nr:hydroxymethylbilane synthase [Lachnospiraceae bacterium]